MNTTAKQINAYLALTAAALLLVHLCYTVVSYLLFYYHAVITAVIGHALGAIVIAHILLSAVNVFGRHDTISLRTYPRLNIRTILQRVSVLIAILLVPLHLRTGKAVSARTVEESGFRALMVTEILFWGLILLHIALSLTRAFVTLGWLRSAQGQKRADRIIWVVCALLFAAAAVVVIRTRVAIFYL